MKSQDALYAHTHSETSIDEVQAKLRAYSRYRLVECDIISDPLPDSVHRVAVANIDVDIYEATKSALEKLYQLIVCGGIMIVEDYGHTPRLSGAFVAVRQFLNSSSGRTFTPVHRRSGQIFLVRHSI